MSSTLGLAHSNGILFLESNQRQALQIESVSEDWEQRQFPLPLTSTVKVQWQSLFLRAGKAGVTESRTVNTRSYLPGGSLAL